METFTDLGLTDTAKVLRAETGEDTVRATEAEAEREAQLRSRLLNSAGGPDLDDQSIMTGAWT